MWNSTRAKMVVLDNEAGVGRPTSVTFLSSRPNPSNATQCLVGTTTGWLTLIDVETGKVVNKVAPPTESPSGAPTTESDFNEGDLFNHQPSNVNLSMCSSLLRSGIKS